MGSKKLKGKIIRILDQKTVVINLGSEDGIKSQCIFFILGEPEPVVDPQTKEVLGTVTVTKGRVKASQVFDKFTIATTSWTTNTVRTNYDALFGSIFPKMETGTVDEGELKVDPADIKPWRARSESPVKVGDEVEVTIDEPEEEPEKKEAASKVSPSKES